MYFKAFIRVVKSIGNESYFGFTNQIREPLIEAANKDEVKRFLLEKYPQFFQKGKVYEKETKDTAQFFYVVIYELWKNEIELVNEGEWTCDYCGQVHKNKYEVRPNRNERLLPNKQFCPSDEDYCLNRFLKDKYKEIDMIDDLVYVKKDSLNYIYKITEKSTGKCYIGKTRNEPFFRWWDHLKRNYSEFGQYFRNTKLDNWTFEVVEILPSNIEDAEVFKIESQYIIKYNSIENGFNSLISNRSVLDKNL